MKLFKTWFKKENFSYNRGKGWKAGELHKDGIFWISSLYEIDVINNPNILYIGEQELYSYRCRYWYNPKKHKVYSTRVR